MADLTLYGIPRSYLGYSKSQIKQALVIALGDLQPDEIDLRETLIHSYLHLAQFIDDDKADIAQRGQRAIISGDINHPDIAVAEHALGIINEIKTDMETLRSEIRSILSRKGLL